MLWSTPHDLAKHMGIQRECTAALGMEAFQLEHLTLDVLEQICSEQCSVRARPYPMLTTIGSPVVRAYVRLSHCTLGIRILMELTNRTLS